MNLCVLQFPLFVPVLIMYMCVGACVLHMGAYRGQKMSDPLKLELQVVASYLMGCRELSSGPLQKQKALLAAPLPSVLILKVGMSVLGSCCRRQGMVTGT